MVRADTLKVCTFTVSSNVKIIIPSLASKMKDISCGGTLSSKKSEADKAMLDGIGSRTLSLVSWIPKARTDRKVVLSEVASPVSLFTSFESSLVRRKTTVVELNCVAFPPVRVCDSLADVSAF